MPPTSGSFALSRIQMFAETTAGTIGACTTLWRGKGALADTRETKFAEETIGVLVPLDRSYVAKLGGALTMDSIEANFEQLPYILSAGIKDAASVRNGTGSAYMRNYVFPTTSQHTLKTYTLRGGDDYAAEIMEYCYVDKFTLEGKAGEAWMVSADWLGRQVVPTTFTAGVAVPAIEDMMFGKTKIYIDPDSGNFGATQKTMTLLSAKLDVSTGWIPKYTADGGLYFSFLRSTAPDITLELTFEHDATSVAEIVAWRAETARLIRLLVEGSTFTTTGTTYSKKTLIIDLAGKWESINKLDEQDGNSIRIGTFKGRYNATKGEVGRILVVNALATLP